MRIKKAFSFLLFLISFSIFATGCAKEELSTGVGGSTDPNPNNKETSTTSKDAATTSVVASTTSNEITTTSVVASTTSNEITTTSVVASTTSNEVTTTSVVASTTSNETTTTSVEPSTTSNETTTTSVETSTTSSDPKACSNGLDDDDDGLIDADDPGCVGPDDDDEYNEPDPKNACEDGIDNDGDEKIDMDDPGCSDPSDNDESDDPPQCSDSIDNDGDGKTDYPADPGCSSPDDDDETDVEADPECSDGIDNDGDGRIDEGDKGCYKPDNCEYDPNNPESCAYDPNDNDESNDIIIEFGKCFDPIPADAVYIPNGSIIESGSDIPQGNKIIKTPGLAQWGTTTGGNFAGNYDVFGLTGGTGKIDMIGNRGGNHYICGLDVTYMDEGGADGKIWIAGKVGIIQGTGGNTYILGDVTTLNDPSGNTYIHGNVGTVCNPSAQVDVYGTIEKVYCGGSGSINYLADEASTVLTLYPMENCTPMPEGIENCSDIP